MRASSVRRLSASRSYKKPSRLRRVTNVITKGVMFRLTPPTRTSASVCLPVCLFCFGATDETSKTDLDVCFVFGDIATAGKTRLKLKRLIRSRRRRRRRACRARAAKARIQPVRCQDHVVNVHAQVFCRGCLLLLAGWFVCCLFYPFACLYSFN